MMKHSEYSDTFRSRDVEDEIRKSRHHGAPDPAIYDGTRFGMAAHGFESLAQHGEKLASETGAL